MHDFHAARALVRATLADRALDTERLTVASARGRVLAAPLAAARDLPGFVHSAMDGYAFDGAALGADGEAGFRLVGTMLAGTARPSTIVAGECVRIATGAPLPAGADTVAMQENCEVDGEQVRVRATSAGANVRQADDDYRAGDALLAAGAILSPAALSTLAAFGLVDVAVRRRARVGVLVTGDELVAPPAEPGYGQRYDSNGTLLCTLLAQHGAEARHVHVRDDPVLIGIALDALLDDCDLVLSTGGASVGLADHLPTLAAARGEVLFHKVRMRPGMPVLFAHCRGRPYFALPGNPASVFATFVAFVRPALAALSLAPALDPPPHPVRLVQAIAKRHARLELRRAHLSWSGDGVRLALPHPVLSSGALRSVVESDALIELAAERERFEPDTVVPAYPLALA